MENRNIIIELLTTVRYTTNDIEKVADEICSLFNVIECVQFDADEIIAFLNDCETLDEAKMFADEHLR
jgi:predicted RNA binding protein with dsRBD fold (UPF0201 family)